MSGSLRDGQLDPAPRPPQVPRWVGCRCDDVGKGGCGCDDDDGRLTHGGVHREGFDHGVYMDGRFVRA